jgi:hypothetical protein
VEIILLNLAKDATVPFASVPARTPKESFIRTTGNHDEPPSCYQLLRRMKYLIFFLPGRNHVPVLDSMFLQISRRTLSSNSLGQIP